VLYRVPSSSDFHTQITSTCMQAHTQTHTETLPIHATVRLNVDSTL